MSTQTANQARILALIILLSILRITVSLGPVERAFQSVARPLDRWLSDLAYSEGVQPANERQAASARIFQLESELDGLRREGGVADSIVTVKVLRKDIRGIRKFITIDNAPGSKIKAGDPVVSDGFLIGRISEIRGAAAVVQLINDPQFRITASAGTNAHGVIKTLQGSLVFDLVPRNSLEGERLVSDGIDGEFPPGLLIGIVGARITPPDAVFERFHVMLANSPAQLSLVSVIKGELS